MSALFPDSAQNFVSVSLYKVELYALIFRDGQILLMQLADGMRGLPGGPYTNPKHSTEKSLRLLVRQQTGLVVGKFVMQNSYISHQEELPHLNIIFTADYASGLARPGEGVGELQWTPLARLTPGGPPSPLASEAIQRARQERGMAK